MIEALLAASLYADTIHIETPDYRFVAEPEMVSPGVTRYSGTAHLKTVETPGDWSPNVTREVSMYLNFDMGGTCVDNVWLSFDHATVTGGQGFIAWTETLAVGTWCPRHFSWEVNETCVYGSEELAQLLAAWGAIDSQWDLDGDGVVGGIDLALLVGGM